MRGRSRPVAQSLMLVHDNVCYVKLGDAGAGPASNRHQALTSPGTPAHHPRLIVTTNLPRVCDASVSDMRRFLNSRPMGIPQQPCGRETPFHTVLHILAETLWKC